MEWQLCILIIKRDVGVCGLFYMIKNRNAPTGGFAAVARCFFMDRFRVEQHCEVRCQSISALIVPLPAMSK
jgi:hypothetical protein